MDSVDEVQKLSCSFAEPPCSLEMDHKMEAVFYFLMG